MNLLMRLCCRVLLFVGLCNFLSCTSEEKPATLFTSIGSEASGIDFENTVTETERVNLLTNEYTFMGGGVGVGDFNNDGLQDLFFTGSQTSCKLYINKGNFTFDDVTQQAGLTTNKWCTGVSVVDINNDGWLDIYVCVSGSLVPEDRRNLLYINNRNLTFTEMVATYGLADDHFSTQAAFIDYDKDGLLDMYLVNHQMYGQNINRVIPKDLSGSSVRNDQLYHNKGIDVKTGQYHFENVTLPSGIKEDGYGLGIAITDFNGDNWPDIYVSNDYIGNDCMWLNQQDGTFKNVAAQSLNHQSYSSMGTDAADINNDGLADIVTLDMMPPGNERKKMMYSVMTNERLEMEKTLQYDPSYMHNSLHLNRGVATVNNSLVPVFSDIANLAGMAETDWSWSVLAADFTGDGLKDMHITNGLGRDLLNSDFAAFSAANAAGGPNKVLLDKLQSYGDVPLPDYLFVNNGDYTFRDESERSGINQKTISNGAAYADLDNDGDLDLVVNNINSKAFLFSNNTRKAEDSSAHFLSIRLQGSSTNPNAFGTTVRLFLGDSIILLEQNPVRGYLSSVDHRLYTGLGTATTVDSIQVIWPDDAMQTLRQVKANQMLTLKHEQAAEKWTKPTTSSALFTNYTTSANINFEHQDSLFFDYAFQRLLPQKFSSQGPGIAVGDVNGDGLEDFFIGNGFAKKGMIFLQQSGGRFTSKTLETGEKIEEDAGCLLLDADGDGDKDLVVTSGTTEFEKDSPFNLPRLYINDGKGSFTRSLQAFPAHLNAITCVVKASDFDNDGDLDLFLGGRVASRAYPQPPPSYLLQNNKGIFTDITQTACPALLSLGMVTDAAWADIDGDETEELIVSGEWMPIRMFKKQGAAFAEITQRTGLQPFSGMWRTLAVADVDKDGDLDLIGGNLGLNNKYHFDSTYPLQLWYADVDGNGSIDPIAGYYMPSPAGDRQLYPALNLNELTGQVPAIKKRFLLHQEFATTSLSGLMDGYENLVKLTATEAASCWFENSGKGVFTKHVLPSEAQFAPINTVLVNDYNSDGHPDILLAGNEYEAEVNTGIYDGSYGLLLLGSANKQFAAQSLRQSGIYLRGDTRCLREITVDNTTLVLAGINAAQLQVYKVASQ